MNENAPDEIADIVHEPRSNSSGNAGGVPSPQIVKSIALACLVIGPLLAVIDIVSIGNAVSVYARNIPDALFFHYLVNISIYLDMLLLFLIGGVGLALNRRWGRTISYFAAVACFVAWFAAFALGGVVKRLVEEGEIRLRTNPIDFHFDLPWSLSVFGPLFAIFLLVLLSLPAMSRWARSRPSVPSLPTAKWSGTAIGSFISSLVPMGFFQLAGVGLGIAALIQIRKSNGALRGKSLAITGIIISSALLVFLVAFLVGGAFIFT